MKIRPWAALLALAVTASGTFLFVLTSQLTFIADGWDLLLRRQGWSPSAFLNPLNEHLIAGPTVVYKLLLAAFGMDSAVPFYAVSITLFLLSAVLLFIYMRPRVGDWLALIATVVILFLGAASEDLLWEFQMTFFGSVAAGLGVLLALDREDRRGDRFACVLLLVSLAFSGVGVAFLAAAAANLAFGRRPRARRAYVVLLPLVAYALWWLGWGRTAESHISLENVEQLPEFLFDFAAAGMASLLGRDPLADSGDPPLIGQVLVVILVAVVLVRVARHRQVSAGLAVALVLAFSFWILIGLDRSIDRYATGSRYQYPSAVFLLLIGAELLRGVKIPRPVTAALTVVAAASVLGGISITQREHEYVWKPMADEIRLTLAAIEIAGDRVRPDFPIRFTPTIVVPARTYLAAEREHGSPAFDEAELLERPGFARHPVDHELAEALGIGLARPDPQLRPSRCRVMRPAASSPPQTTLEAGTYVVENLSQKPAGLQLSRFAQGFPVELGPLRPRLIRTLAIPRDSSARPWRLSATDGSVRLCMATTRSTRK